MIDASEIEFAELLGAGGFGEVRKAVWRGTEGAVKTVASGYITNDIRNAFIDEVRLMTSLRHPNVVLFMGAATKPPKMCIGMTYHLSFSCLPPRAHPLTTHSCVL